MAGLLRADDASPSADGTKSVIGPDGNLLPVRVKDQPDALAHAKFFQQDELDHQRAFSAENPMGSKSFSFPSSTTAQGSYKGANQDSFVTKSYNFDANSPTAPNLNHKSDFPTTSAYSRGASGFSKSFSTSNADAGQNQTALVASTTSPDQGRTAVLGGQTTDTYASPLSGKEFLGDEADAAHRNLSRNKDGKIVVSDLPSRPLTIDEVRELINHGFKPNTDEKPADEPSKPLNDPNYKPQPLRDMPPVPPASEEDKDDAVPPPGTIAQPPPPENAQPLPQP